MDETITVNGEEAGMPQPRTIAGLLAALNLDPDKVAVERNRKLVRGSTYDTVELQPGDDIEIVTFVGGG
ncbi:MAG: sulfur carrier protein ThiS [Planctomycetota bacterium]